MLDVRRMQLLRAVVTSGSVTSAAGNLGYTPSAISQQLAVLEREAGVPLLVRVAVRGVGAATTQVPQGRRDDREDERERPADQREGED
ncbi:LysR family transcriptional regulator, partial [Kibdelosporangium lantanae]